MISWDNIQEGINKVAENYPEFSVVYHGEYGSRMCIPPKVIVQRSPEAASEATHRDKNIMWVKDENESIVSDPNKVYVPQTISINFCYIQSICFQIKYHFEKKINMFFTSFILCVLRKRQVFI